MISLKRTMLLLGIGISTLTNAEDTVVKLSWMTGSWIGQLGPNAIEEIWTKPNASSIQASVRIVNNDKTVVHEFIVITQTEDGIVLYLQQWGPDYSPLAPATKMTMTEMTENSISFLADEGAAIEKLSYRRVDDKTFHIAVTSKGASEMVIVLTPNA